MTKTCFVIMIGVMASFMALASPAEAAPVYFSCVFQGAGSLQRTLKIDLEAKTVFDGFSPNDVVSIGEINDIEIKWHTQNNYSYNDNVFNRVSGAMMKSVKWKSGEVEVWNYVCSRTEKVL